MKIGQLMKDARMKAQKSLRSFAEELEVSPGLLSLIERDLQPPTKELIVRASSLLGQDADLWCAAAGTITPDAEAALAQLAKTNPTYLRRLVANWKAANA